MDFNEKPTKTEHLILSDPDLKEPGKNLMLLLYSEAAGLPRYFRTTKGRLSVLYPVSPQKPRPVSKKKAPVKRTYTKKKSEDN